jgi:hypothetical protein
MRMATKHISEMLDISDEDSKEVLKDIAISVATHHLMSEVLSELAVKYGKKGILAGMMVVKAFELNEAASESAEKQDYGHG